MSARSQGFSIIEVVMVIGFLFLIGMVGYVMLNRSGNMGSDQSPTASDVQMAPSITTVADLDSAWKLLDGINPDASNKLDVEQLDSQLTAF